MTKLEHFASSTATASQAQFYHAALMLVAPANAMRTTWQRELSPIFAHVEVADKADIAQQLCQRCYFDVLIIHTETLDPAAAWLQQLRQTDLQNTALIFITDQPSFALAQTALRLGAAELLTLPLSATELLQHLQCCLTQTFSAGQASLRPVDNITVTGVDIVCHSERFKRLCDVVTHIAPTQSTVLLVGETGTGKELLAQTIHAHSGRKGEFVPLNCGSIAAELLESELFGHAKGAFTNAHQAREGLFSYAKGGTLFLDEIGEMPLSMQAKLLRVLEARKVRAVGTEKELPVDVRIIAATNRQLEQAVQQQQFRQDLYYRLNVLSLDIPPLRERVEDIAPLARHFMRQLAGQLGTTEMPLRATELQLLEAHPWYGNVRELRNVIERALLLDKLPSVCLENDDPQDVPQPSAGELGYPVDWQLAAVEKHHILKILTQVQGNKSEAARILGVSRKTLERRLQAWNE